MIRVVLESPLNAPTREGIENNKIYARRAMLDSLMRGEAPFASHLLYDQKGILDDLVVSERQIGLQAGLEWGKQAHKVVVYRDRGISAGMQMGIDFYRHQGLEVEYREIGA